jgi:trans-feruloyl-CoA hydratase/vanillin synthase
MLPNYSKPTIAMVNGWCFGGAFTPLVGCDLAIAAEEAQFGLSEINWGIIPGGNVTRSVVATMNLRNAMYYVMTGKTFDGKKAAEMGLVNEAVPLANLREHTRELAKELLGKNPTVLRACKQAVRGVLGMSWELSDDYLMAKSHQSRYLDTEGGRSQGLKQFLDEKSFRPGLGGYKRDA